MTAASGQRSTVVGEVSADLWRETLAKMEQVYQDVLAYETELEASNAALEESQQFIASVLGAMTDVLIVCGRDGLIEDVNHALAELTGRSADGWRGEPAQALFADAASCEQFAALLARCRQGAVADVDLRLRGRNGGVPVSFNATPRLDAAGRPLGVVLTGRPVGELKRAYEDLRAAHDELQRTQQRLLQSEKMASLGLLVAGVAHELNNPVSFVVGNVHVLRRYLPRLRRYLQAADAGASDEARQALKRELRLDRLLADLDGLIDGIVEGAERTRETVAALRRFAEPAERYDEVFDLGEAVERAARWATRSGPAGLAVELDLAPQLHVRGSAGELQQVVVNMVQYAAAAGARRLAIEARPHCDRVDLGFRDDGSGIAPENLPRLFEPFFTTKPVGQGMGLGLAICYGIVERHGGAIEAANLPGGGAVFTVRLPLEMPRARAQRAAPMEADSPPAPRPAPRRP